MGRADEPLPLFPCWSPGGWEWWESAAETSMVEVARMTRGRAAAAHAFELGEPITEVRVWKRWVRPLTYGEAWEYYRDRLACLGEAGDEDPMPDGWEPNEDCPWWEFCAPGTPGASAWWVCGSKGDTPPQKPSRRREAVA